ncbi:amino acid permease [Arthrobacter crystallopoietes BAB-32]|uniref:Amino acid permease n=1 Tax=Arthrobacter crystallopoietes BAB-32 TaxID=1246476 RepID=N1UYI6_9MICC|nr:APC family permease [Arthrobacter crystallopoietes]EMY32892.1 amino acid permease [Arthrobacter crystallopoietes BAB-32]
MSTTRPPGGKGLAAGQLGLLAVVVIGISTIAPAYVLTSTLGPTVQAIGPYLPAIFIVGFIPMFLVALGYRELNADSPDSGTTFTWVTKAFGPFIGWMGGWGLLAANIIVLSNLAGVAVDFFYLFLAQLTGDASLADLAANKVVNVLTCLVFVALAVWVSCRGVKTTKAVQYILVAFQLGVLAWFTVGALSRIGTVPGTEPLAFSWAWFNPFGIESFSAFALGLSLSIFAFWGWDVCLTVNEETTNGRRTSGAAATVTAVVVLAIYLAGSVATVMFAGTGDTGLGLNNPDIAENVFTAIAGPVMGPFAILLSLAVLSSCASSLQSTMISPARSLLAMGYYKALPESFGKVSPRFKSPVFATVVAGAVSAGFYTLMRFVSDNVLNDTIMALGLMICFYYGLTALACVWYFRRTALASARNLWFRFIFPLLGGLALVVVFVQTAVDSWDPAFGSGSELFGIGLVFVIGVGLIALGLLVMLWMYRRRPEYFRGETLQQESPALELPE